MRIIDITVCGEMQYEVSAPTVTSDRVCEDYTVCTEMQFEAKPPTYISDRLCEGMSVERRFIATMKMTMHQAPVF